MDVSNQTGQPLPARGIWVGHRVGVLLWDNGKHRQTPPSLDFLGRVGCSLWVSVPHGVACPMQSGLSSLSE